MHTQHFKRLSEISEGTTGWVVTWALMKARATSLGLPNSLLSHASTSPSKLMTGISCMAEVILRMKMLNKTSMLLDGKRRSKLSGWPPGPRPAPPHRRSHPRMRPVEEGQRLSHSHRGTLTLYHLCQHPLDR